MRMHATFGEVWQQFVKWILLNFWLSVYSSANFTFDWPPIRIVSNLCSKKPEIGGILAVDFGTANSRVINKWPRPPNWKTPPLTAPTLVEVHRWLFHQKSKIYKIFNLIKFYHKLEVDYLVSCEPLLCERSKVQCRGWHEWLILPT